MLGDLDRLALVNRYYLFLDEEKWGEGHTKKHKKEADVAQVVDYFRSQAMNLSRD